MTDSKAWSEKLVYTKKSVFERREEKEIDAAYEYARGYAAFLDAAKTEREAVREGVRMATDMGFCPYQFGDAMQPGDKFYYNNHGKSLYLFVVGSEPVENGIRIAAAHVDSPRLDLKPCPLYEDRGMAFFKTHYYGGVRKYQWVTVPLALHGVVILKDGSSVTVTVGEEDTDPIFYINDLLPHLGRAQGEKPLNTAIAGEKLNVLIGSRPLSDADKDGVKINVLKMLNDKYGITERELMTAELCVVPALKARDVGFDRSMIAAYGHDDRVCAYPSMTALFECEDAVHTSIVILADKEETGSDGATGMQCEVILDLIDCLAESLGGKSSVIRANSKCLSSDVTANFEPNFPEPFEIRNSSIINCGVSVAKYTGSGGKGGTNDATAEYASWLRNVLDNAGVVWQIAELGAVDAGGGGTVAKFLSKHNIDTIDIGVGVTAMHAPYELIAKADLYEAHRAFCAFLRA